MEGLFASQYATIAMSDIEPDALIAYARVLGSKSVALEVQIPLKSRQPKKRKNSITRMGN
ncbi:MAG: hypothetical protein IJX92_02505 [Clostridia bacterium]|nr:hypothetical protein [Clostridia bacterium]